MTSSSDENGDHQNDHSGAENDKDNGNDGTDDQDKKLSPTELAIIEMMRKQNIQMATQERLMQAIEGGGGGDQQKKHTFWDTQVR